MKLFPQPRHFELAEGAFRVTCVATCTLPDFFDHLKQGYEGVAVVTEPLLGKEEYRIVVTESGVTVAAACDEGLFRAATTLRQMIRQTGGEVPCCTIQDKPDIARRGYMIDISRGKKPR